MEELQKETHERRRFHMPWWLAACAVVAIAVMLLWDEHEAHILGTLTYLILLACPLIHIFMHRGHSCHGGHDHGGHDRSAKDQKSQAALAIADARALPHEDESLDDVVGDHGNRDTVSNVRAAGFEVVAERRD